VRVAASGDKDRMLEVRLDAVRSIVFLHPTSALQKADFEQLSRTIDPHIEKTGGLRGLILDLEAFPGWESIGAMAAHFKFVREHHTKVKKIAVVTDAKIGNLAETLASHFVAATIKHFPGGQVQAAEKWIDD
jgi:hypothetical protein